MTIHEFIGANGITMTASYIGWKSDRQGWGHDAWRCTLRMAGRRMQVAFNMGTGHEGREPDLPMVLDSLTSDAAMLENAQWDIDSFTAELMMEPYGEGRRIFNATVRQTESLQRLLGHDAELYEQLLWQVERE